MEFQTSQLPRLLINSIIADNSSACSLPDSSMILRKLSLMDPAKSNHFFLNICAFSLSPASMAPSSQRKYILGS